MAGYTRQSTAQIVPGAEVQANPINAEFNQLQSAFNGTTGHTHDGSVGNGAKIDLGLAVSGVLPVAFGGTGVATAVDARTVLFGLTTTVDNTVPRFDGTSGALQTSGITVSDTNAVSGVLTLAVSNGGSLAGTWSTLGTVTTMALLGGSINGTPIGATSASTGVFTTLNSTSHTTTTLTATNTSISGTFALTGDLVQVAEGGTGANTAAGARANLGVEPLPPGMVVCYAMTSPPAGWLECTGAAVSRTTFANLFTAIGTTFGAGDGSTTFNIPDLRGEFIRGLDSGRGVDAGRVFGSAQTDSLDTHTHTGTTATEGAHTHTWSGTTSTAAAHAHNISGNTGYVSADHAHNWGANTGNESNTHTHAFTDNRVTHYQQFAYGSSSGGLQSTEADNTGGQSILHYHYVGGGTSGINANHYHGVSGGTDAQGAHSHSVSGTTSAGAAHSHTFTTNATGDTETRPRNVALIYCIKT